MHFKIQIIDFVDFSAFRQGMHDLKVWPNVEADPDVKSTTPGKTKDNNDQMSRLAKVGCLAKEKLNLLGEMILMSTHNIKWAATWQNQQNDQCAQRTLRSAWASTQSDRVFAVHSMGS